MLTHMLVLWAIAILVLGFVVRLNPLLVVVIAALTAGVLAAWSGGAHSLELLGAALVRTVETLGHEYNKVRYVTVVWLILPLIGLLEREGLQERARQLMGKIRAATPGRTLIAYFLVRQGTAALGLTSICGHAQTVRPLIAPMTEGAAETRYGPLSDKVRFRLRAWAAATDNVAVFFGEDIFIAVSSILLIAGTLQSSGIVVQPIELSLWALPTAACALLIHGFRLWRLDRRLDRELGEKAVGVEGAGA
jgi:uncharacterized membrane protein